MVANSLSRPGRVIRTDLDALRLPLLCNVELKFKLNNVKYQMFLYFFECWNFLWQGVWLCCSDKQLVLLPMAIDRAQSNQSVVKNNRLNKVNYFF